MNVAIATLREVLNDLGLNETVEGSEIRVARLLDYYGSERAQVLVGFMVICDTFGAERVVPLGLCKRSTFYERRRALRIAGAWLHSNGKRQLPQLRLVVPRELAISRAA